jgi:hypothetical protein
LIDEVNFMDLVTRSSRSPEGGDYDQAMALVLLDGESSWPLWVKSRRRQGTIHYLPSRA